MSGLVIPGTVNSVCASNIWYGQLRQKLRVVSGTRYGEPQFAKCENLPLGEKKRQVGLAVPYGRMGTPEDMVEAAVFLASADAEYIVAQTLNVDGGNWMS